MLHTRHKDRYTCFDGVRRFLDDLQTKCVWLAYGIGGREQPVKLDDVTSIHGSIGVDRRTAFEVLKQDISQRAQVYLRKTRRRC